MGHSWVKILKGMQLFGYMEQIAWGNWEKVQLKSIQTGTWIVKVKRDLGQKQANGTISSIQIDQSG